MSVTASGRPVGGGTVRVVTKRAGHRWTVTRHVRNGHARMRLPRLKALGTYRVRARFTGTRTVAARSSARVLLHVVRSAQGRPRGGSCSAPQFPDASCTGVPAGTALTRYAGPSTISVPGTVVDGKVLGCVRVTAPGVVIRRSKISCANPATDVVGSFDGDYSGTPLLLEDVEIDCQDGPGTAVGEARVTVRRADIHGCENGFDINQSVTVEDSYIHDLWNSAESHSDGMQLAGHLSNGAFVKGALNVTIRHNTIFGVGADGSLGTSAIIANRSGDRNVLIEQNLLAGGAYSLYCDGDTATNFRVVHNHFSKRFSSRFGAYGPSDGCADETLAGNVVHETGAPIHLD